jgi:hypothetical protein
MRTTIDSVLDSATPRLLNGVTLHSVNEEVGIIRERERAPINRLFDDPLSGLDDDEEDETDGFDDEDDVDDLDDEDDDGFDDEDEDDDEEDDEEDDEDEDDDDLDDLDDEEDDGFGYDEDED